MTPRGPRKLALEFSAHNLTHYGGVYLLHRFLSKVGFRIEVANKLQVKQRNNRYSVGEMLLAILYPMILGIERLETTTLLREDVVFQYLTGLPGYPDATSLRRFLLRAAPQMLPRLRTLHDRFLRRMSDFPHRPARLIFDVDSTVLVVYGRQENARIGYNPIKRGRPSYHPLLCFEGQSKDYWHGELRPGDAHTAGGVQTLLESCFAKRTDPRQSVIVRADKGFYDGKFVRWLEANRANFVIVAKLTAPVKRKLAGLRYHRVSHGVEAAEFKYQPHLWPHPSRFVAIRRPEPDEDGPQLTLFKLGRYRYQVLVTNLELQPLNLWRFYNDRAGIELIIRQLKGDYGIGAIPTRHFFANEAYFHLLLLAYNLINSFKRLCLPPEFQKVTLQTLRERVLLVPAQLVRTGNRPRLLLPATEADELWKYALRKIERLKP